MCRPGTPVTTDLSLHRPRYTLIVPQQQQPRNNQPQPQYPISREISVLMVRVMDRKTLQVLLLNLPTVDIIRAPTRPASSIPYAHSPPLLMILSLKVGDDLPAEYC